MAAHTRKQTPMQEAQFAVVSSKDRQSSLTQDRPWGETLGLRSTAMNRAGPVSLGFTTREPESSRDTSESARFSHDFGRISIFSKSRDRIHAKLSIGQPNDFYEQEADRVADRVMHMPEPQIQRACACGGACPTCQVEQQRSKHDRVQRKSVGGNNASPIVASQIVDEVLSSPGQPLDGRTRAYMEPRFGHDFSQVRIHSDPSAAESARAVSALAYTVGREIVFGAGQFAPATEFGRRVLAHELAHVVQQTGAAASCTRPLLQRWAISGKFAMADQDSDTLGGLAQAAGANVDDWKCIRPTPLSMSIGYTKDRPADFDEQYDRYIAIGDKFDISNLTRETGSTLVIHLFAESNPYAGVTQQFYPGVVGTNDAANAIVDAARAGRTPIAEMVIVGHAHEGTMFGDATVFTPKDFDPEEPRPSFARTEEGKYPRRCWFTRNAAVRSVGCDSETWGKDFARHFLRVGATVTTTTAVVQGTCSGKSPEYVAVGGDCKYKLDGLEFRTPWGTLLDGPFWNVDDFHGAGSWSKVNGKL